MIENKSGKIVLFIFLAIAACLSVAAFVMTFTNKCPSENNTGNLDGDPKTLEPSRDTTGNIGGDPKTLEPFELDTGTIVLSSDIADCGFDENNYLKCGKSPFVWNNGNQIKVNSYVPMICKEKEKGSNKLKILSEVENAGIGGAYYC